MEKVTAAEAAAITAILYTVIVLCVVWILGRAGRLGAQDRATDRTDAPSPPPERAGSTQSSYGGVDAPPVVSKILPHQGMVLLITKCSDPQMWYAGKVGQEVPYLGSWPGEGYRSREDSGFVNLVKFTDARVVVKS